MSEQKLCVGELVQLNSGGPSLTVSAVNPDFVTVVWIGDLGESGRYGKAEFPRACVHKIS